MPPLLIFVLIGDRKHYDFLVPQAIAASSSAVGHAGPSVIMEKRGFCKKGMRPRQGRSDRNRAKRCPKRCQVYILTLSIGAAIYSAISHRLLPESDLGNFAGK